MEAVELGSGLASDLLDGLGGLLDGLPCQHMRTPIETQALTLRRVASASIWVMAAARVASTEAGAAMLFVVWVDGVGWEHCRQ